MSTAVDADAAPRPKHLLDLADWSVTQIAALFDTTVSATTLRKQK